MKQYSLLSQDFDNLGQGDLEAKLRHHGVVIIDSYEGNILVRGDKAGLLAIMQQFGNWRLIEVQELS